MKVERPDRGQPLLDGSLSLYTGSRNLKLLGWSRELEIRIHGGAPMPCTVLGIRGEIEMNLG